MNNQLRGGRVPEEGDYTVVAVVAGRHKGRFGFRDDDPEHPRGGAVVYLGPKVSLSLLDRIVAGDYQEIPDRNLRVIEDRHDELTAHMLMNPRAMADLFHAQQSKLDRLGAVMKRVGGGESFDADLARIEVALSGSTSPDEQTG